MVIVGGPHHHILCISLAIWTHVSTQPFHIHLAESMLCLVHSLPCSSLVSSSMKRRWNSGVGGGEQHVSFFLSSRSVSEPEGQLPDT